MDISYSHVYFYKIFSYEGENMREKKEHEEKSVDRRIRKTKTALKHSLTVLMQKKKVKDISVKELTELSDINRGTFYLHYRDVFDLLEQSEEDLLREFRETLDSYSEEFLVGNPMRLFQAVFTLCKNNADLVRILIGENGDIKFLNQLKKLLREKCLTDWSTVTKEKQSRHFDAYFAFTVGGCLSLLQNWFATGMQESPAELAEITKIFLDRDMPKAG